MKKIFTRITRWLSCAALTCAMLPLTAQAQCEALGVESLPLELNFNNGTITPDCWSTDGAVNLSLSTAYGGSGFAINFIVASDAGAYLISPVLSMDISGLAVAFRAYGVAGRKLSVGALLTPGDLSSLEQIGVAELTADDTWTDFYIPVGEDFAGTSNVSLVIYAGSGDDATPIYLDDLSIEVKSDCQRPSNITLGDYTSAASFSWDANGAEAWDVVLTLNGEEAFNGRVSEAQVSVPGLQSSTEYQYEISVKAVCGNAQSSATTATGNFKTACGALGLPFSEDFEALDALPECWTFFTSSQSYAKFRVRATANVEVNGKGLDFQNSRGKNVMFAVLPPLGGQDVSLYTATFKYSQDRKTGKLEFGYLYDAADTTTFVSLTGALPQSGSYLPTSLYSAEVELDIVPSEAKALAWKFYAPGEDVNAAIDDIRIDKKSDCGKPAGISVQALTSSGVNVLINDPDASHSQWEVAAVQGTDSIKQVLSQRSGAISGLQAATTYSLAVRTLCDNGKSPWVAGPEFTTGCLPQGNAETGFTETFDSYRNVADMKCWQFSTPSQSIIFRGDDEEEAEYVSDYVQSKRSLALVYAPNYAVAPELSFPLSGTLVKFWLYLDADALRVGYADPNNVEGTFTEVQLFEPQVGEVTVSFEGVEVPEGYRLVFYYYAAERGDWSPCAIDNLNILPSTGCSTPSDLYLSNITNSNVDINWYGEAEQYHVLVYEGKIDYSALGSARVARELTTSNLSAQFNNLMPQTTYTVTVQGICGEARSNYAEPVYFTTECDAIRLPYVDSFEDGQTSWGCWKLLSGTASPSTREHSDGAKSLYIQSAEVIAASPRMEEPLANCKLSFDARTLYGATLYVGVMSDPSDASTLFNLTTIDLPETTGLGFPSYSLFFKDILADSELQSYADSHYFAFTIASNSNYGYVYIDNLKVEVADECLPATALQLTSVDDESASIIWTSNGAQSATVEFYLAPYTNGATPAISHSVTTRGITVHGLAPQTTYYVYVINDCQNGQTALRSAVLEITTLGTAQSVPFKHGFEDGEGDLFSFVNDASGANAWMVGNAAEAVHSGSKALYVSNGNGFEYTTTAPAASWAYTTLKFDEAGDYQVSYAWRNNGQESEDFLSIFLAPATTKLAIGAGFWGDSYYGTIGGQGVYSTSTPSVAGLHVLDHGVYGSEEWYETTRDINISEPGSYILAFLWNNDGSNGEQHPAAIDDIEVKKKVDTSLMTVQGTSIVLTPSVINRGETVSVNHSFTAQQLNGMTIEVIDMAGRSVSNAVAQGEIKIGGFNAAGLYIVRLRAGNGDLFTGRVLVK